MVKSLTYNYDNDIVLGLLPIDLKDNPSKYRNVSYELFKRLIYLKPSSKIPFCQTSYVVYRILGTNATLLDKSQYTMLSNSNCLIDIDPNKANYVDIKNNRHILQLMKRAIGEDPITTMLCDNISITLNNENTCLRLSFPYKT